jgi:hypothetical protein
MLIFLLQKAVRERNFTHPNHTHPYTFLKNATDFCTAEQKSVEKAGSKKCT